MGVVEEVLTTVTPLRTITVLLTDWPGPALDTAEATEVVPAAM